MAWQNLRAELEEEFSGLSRAQDTERLIAVGAWKIMQDQKERDASIPETKAQATHRRRLARAKRVEGLARGQH